MLGLVMGGFEMGTSFGTGEALHIRCICGFRYWSWFDKARTGYCPCVTRIRYLSVASTCPGGISLTTFLYTSVVNKSPHSISY
jgi:hypothetical protein